MSSPTEILVGKRSHSSEVEHSTFNGQVAGSNLAGIKMSRSIWKGPFRPNISSPLTILSRNGTITPDLINTQVKVHNGIMYSKAITISTNHIGRKFGSLFKTKKKGSYKKTASKGGKK